MGEGGLELLRGRSSTDSGNMNIRAVLASALVTLIVFGGCKEKEDDYTYLVSPGIAAQTGEYQITLTRDWKPKSVVEDHAAGGEFENRKYGAQMQILFWKAETGNDWLELRQKNEDLLERLRTRPGFIEIFGTGFMGGIDITTPKSPGGNVPHARIKGFLFGRDGFFTVTGESLHPLDQHSIDDIMAILKGLQSSEQIKKKESKS